MTQDDRDRLVRIEEGVTALRDSKADHEGRIRKLEHRQWWTMGFAGAVTFIVELFRPKH